MRYAVELFKYDPCEVTLIHAFADEVYDSHLEMSRSLFDEYRDRVEKNVKDELKATLARLQELSPNPRHSYTTLAIFASLVDAVNDTVEAENADLVVMGTRGETDDRDLTFGSNTLNVVKYITCPVLAVPHKYTDWSPTRVLFPTDFYMPFRRRELKLVNTLCKNFGAQVHILHVSDFDSLSFRQQDNKAFLEDCMCENQREFHTAPGNDVVGTINNFIAEKNIDFLVMVNHRHSLLEDMLYSNTIDTLGLKIHVPFLILQNLPR